ncbi:MAG: hypothetical protein AABX72_04215 [Nanoarchaeota archaeon]
MNEQPDKKQYFLIGLIALTLGIFIFNMVRTSQLSSETETITVPQQSQQQISLKSGIDVTPKGVPEIYGKELGLKYDDISLQNKQKTDATINRLGTLDKQLSVQGKDLQRYIAIVSKISCEYCCGAPGIITADGQPACGCAHSYAMRGLAKYLLLEHGDEYTDDQILEELGKWKTLFFPQQLAQKAQVLKDKGIELNYINLASNKYRDIEQGATGNMAGAC